MPTIPGPKEQSVLPDGTLPYQSSAGATPDAFGGSVGQAFQQAGGAADQIAMRNFAIKNESDRVAAENELMSQTQDLQNGNKATGEVGFRNLVGHNAVDSLQDYQQKVQDAYKSVREGLNPAVQRMFDATAFRIVRGTTDSMGSYSSEQTKVGYHQDSRAGVDLARQGALTHADEPGGWDAWLSKLQEASLAGSRILGLGPDATEEQRQRDVSGAVVERSKQLIVRDPMEAADFYHKNIGSVFPDQRYELEKTLKFSTDAQYSRGDGQAAYHSAIGQPSSSAIPANIGAPYVKPYDQKLIDSRAAFVKSPTPWDDTINAAAKTYNVNPAEIRLKIAMESMGNPQAVSDQGGHGDHATGLGQFTADTAKRYGVTDRNDPVQSINGIARMLAANGGTTGGDMGKSDRAYYGGNVNAKGPNTDQYVENARVVRQAVMGGGAPAPMTAADLEGQEGAVLAAARTQAQQRRPGDAVYADQVVNEAHQAWARDLQAIKGQDYSNMTKVLDATIKTSATTMSDLPPDVQGLASKLTPQNFEGIKRQLDTNARAAAGEYTQSDPKLINKLTQDIYRDDGDPQKITQPGQLTGYMGKGLNYTDMQRLTKEIQQVNTPEGNPFLKQVNNIKQTATKMLTSNLDAADMMHANFAYEAAYRFGVDLDSKIKAARAAKTDPQSLFTPGSKDYVLDPSRVAAFMPTEAQIAARKANAIATPSNTAAPSRIGSDAEYNALPPGTAFIAPDGSRRRKPGETPSQFLARMVPSSEPTASFATEAAASAAAAAGQIRSGDRIKIGNQTGTWH